MYIVGIHEESQLGRAHIHAVLMAAINPYQCFLSSQSSSICVLCSCKDETTFSVAEILGLTNPPRLKYDTVKAPICEKELLRAGNVQIRFVAQPDIDIAAGGGLQVLMIYWSFSF